MIQPLGLVQEAGQVSGQYLEPLHRSRDAPAGPSSRPAAREYSAGPDMRYSSQHAAAHASAWAGSSGRQPTKSYEEQYERRSTKRAREPYEERYEGSGRRERGGPGSASLPWPPALPGPPGLPNHGASGDLSRKTGRSAATTRPSPARGSQNRPKETAYVLQTEGGGGHRSAMRRDFRRDERAPEVSQRHREQRGGSLKRSLERDTEPVGSAKGLLEEIKRLTKNVGVPAAMRYATTGMREPSN